MSTTPLATVARTVRTTVLGSEILAHRIDARAHRWATTDHDTVQDRTPRHDDTATPRQDTTGQPAGKKTGKLRDKARNATSGLGQLSRPARSAIITLSPLLILTATFRPTTIGALLATAGLYLILIVTWSYSPTVALTATYATVATMWPTLMALAALIWLPIAYRTATRDPLAADTPHEEHDSPLEDPLIALVRHLIGDRYGVHLRDIVAALNRSSPERQFNAPEVRAALTQRGVPTRAKVRALVGGDPAAGETATRGVHRDDLPAPTQTPEKTPTAATENPSPVPSPDTPTPPVATNATSL